MNASEILRLPKLCVPNAAKAKSTVTSECWQNEFSLWTLMPKL